MSKSEYLEDMWNKLSTALSHGAKSLAGWAGGFTFQFFGKGTLAALMLMLWVFDFVFAVLLSLKIRNWNEDTMGPMPEELKAAILAKKKGPFSWSKAGWSFHKLFLYLGLAICCGITKEWVAQEKVWYYSAISFACGFVAFVLVFTEFRSVVNNVALGTNNTFLLWANRKILKSGLRTIQSIPGLGADAQDDKVLIEETTTVIVAETKKEVIQ